MGNTLEVQLVTGGYGGAPGYSTFYFGAPAAGGLDEQIHVAYTFWYTLRPCFSSQWTGQLRTEQRLLDEETGALVGFHSTPGAYAASFAGAGGADWGSVVSGAVVGWSTATINWTRQVRGRTFLVPLASDSYNAAGNVAAGRITTIQGAADAIIASENNLGVWSRPRMGAGGLLGAAVSAHVDEKVAFLSSRRD